MRRAGNRLSVNAMCAVSTRGRTPCIVFAETFDADVEQAPDQAWKRRSCGAGAKGQREYDWAAVQLRPVSE